MKKIVYIILFLMSLMLFSSSKKQVKNFNIESIRENILLNTCMNTYKAKSTDENAIQLTSFFLNEKKIVTAVPYDQCESSPDLKYYGLVIALDENAYWNWASFYNNPNFQENFKAVFGINPLRKILYDDGVDKNTGFRFFNPKALKTAFKKLYVKPNTKIKGLTYQKIYDISLKKYFQESAEIVATILKDKKLFKQTAAAYLYNFKNDKNFEGTNFVSSKENLFNASGKFQCVSFNRILSIMLRRQSDGSLDVMLEAFKTILEDYDNDTFKKYQNSF